jgi:DNA-binding NtrC family response regulator
MTKAVRGRTDAVLVTWVSVNHRAAPIVTALSDPKSPLRARVRRVYVCWREASPPDGDREREALRETVKQLHSELDPSCPDIVKVPWKTSASPTDHAAIRTFAEGALRRVRDENPEAEVVIHLSPGTPAMHAVWLALGSTGLIEGPIELIQTADERGRAAGQAPVQSVRFDVDTWLRRYRASQPQKADAEDDGHVWDPARAKSPALREALSKLGEWAPLRVPVLLVGERGTGKTTLANFLRAISPFQRAKRSAWPTVVCGQFRVNPQLARSELFGQVRGAFTGATSDREGLLEQADNDTVFFDEIADIDRDTQRLLMAAIEGRGFQRLGDAKVRHSNFRLVCATNRSLAELRGGVLDADFLDRIAVFVLTIPPLRQCREDLPNAWRRVLSEACRGAGVSPAGWQDFGEHPVILEALASHPLAGNFRDLQRAAYHLLAALTAKRPEAQALDSAIAALGPRDARRPDAPDASALAELLPIDDVRARLVAYERAWLDAAHLKAHGNVSEAARLLGLPRKTFEYRFRSNAEDRDSDVPGGSSEDRVGARSR